MTPNAVETNHHRRNGKVNGKANGKAATLDAAAIAEIVAQLRAIEPTAVEVEAPVDAEPTSQAAPAPAPSTTEAEPAPSATGETTEEQPPKAPIPHNPQREAHYTQCATFRRVIHQVVSSYNRDSESTIDTKEATRWIETILSSWCTVWCANIT